uniref:CGG triplet repeat-binding protein 1 n=1 Tax=Sphenodon punctatus TaxID=8508 RepID=A0A8D0L3M5_SPHPU
MLGGGATIGNMIGEAAIAGGSDLDLRSAEMECFLANKTNSSSNNNNNPGHRSRISARERAAVFKDFHEAEGKLFCTSCNIILDHTRRSTITDHLKSKKHLKRKVEYEARRENRKQRMPTPSVEHQTGAQEVKRELAYEFLRMFLEASLPLEKADHPSVRGFLMHHVNDASSIPPSDQLCRIYFPSVYDSEKRLLKTVTLAGKKIALIVDESWDADYRFILNVLAAPLEKDVAGRIRPYLLDTIFLKSIDHGIVARSVVTVISEYNIAFENVYFFTTDNAAYMKKAFSAGLKVLLPNCIHITRLTHVLDLIMGQLQSPFQLTTTFMSIFRKLPSKRKGRYLDHLRQCNPAMRASVPPDPFAGGWSSYFRAAVYHRDHVKHQAAFLQKEMDQGFACETMERLWVGIIIIKL